MPVEQVMSSEGRNSRGFVKEEDEFDRNLNINDSFFILEKTSSVSQLIEISAVSRFFPVLHVKPA